jgi:CBS-domain-containing membrane protein
VAALGASTFIVFAMLGSLTAEARRLIGGHAVGLLSGALCYLIFLSGHFEQLTTNSELILIVAGALAVGLPIFFMTITDTEHPPAATTALGIIANGWSYKAALYV